MTPVQALLAAGYPYELVGFVYYLFFLMMGRPRFAGRYTKRSRLLMVCAAIVMVGSVPFHYANSPLGVGAIFTIAVLALLSTFADAFRR